MPKEHIFKHFSIFLGVLFLIPGFVIFLMDLGEEMTPESEVGCAENILNTVVFERFHFFTCLVNWMISNRLLDVFLVCFWVPWAHFF